MMSRLIAIALCLAGISSAGFADNQLTFRCDNGKILSITYISGNNYRSARLVFAGTNRPIMLVNQGAASGTYYAGGGWGFIEHQDEFTLVDDTGKPSRSFSCREVRTKQSLANCAAEFSVVSE